MRAAYNGVSYVFVVNDLLLIMSRIITSWDGPRRGAMPVFVAQSTLPNPSVSLEVTEGTAGVQGSGRGLGPLGSVRADCRAVM